MARRNNAIIVIAGCGLLFAALCGLYPYAPASYKRAGLDYAFNYKDVGLTVVIKSCDVKNQFDCADNFLQAAYMAEKKYLAHVGELKKYQFKPRN